METTAITMAITLFYLSNNSKILSKVQYEIDNVVKRGEKLLFEDVQRLNYLEMVIKECMQVKPPVRGVGRCCAKDNVLVNGLKIPKGTDIFVPIMALHHDARYWEKPEVFDPERFNPGSNKKITQFSYLPFMAGARSCIGKNFAMLEAKMIVSRVVQEFDIENPYPEVTDLETTGLVTARPLDGVKLKLYPRLTL
jgi:cholesterol 24(S)-hydroxylase